MNHRVIFPDPNIWTQPRQDTNMTSNPYVGDCRRATALVVHYGHENQEGVREVFKESAEHGRVSEMIVAILDLFQSVIPELLTDLGMACISDVILELAKDTDAERECRRPAALIAHHGNKNVDEINKMFQAAAQEDRITNLVLDVLHLYSTVAPVIYTPLGVQALQRSVLDFAAREDEA